MGRLQQVLPDAPLLTTGAGHDAGILAAERIPAAMLFVRNPTGVSHSPAEWASEADCLAGVEALADVLADLSSVPTMTSYWSPQAWLPAGVADRVRVTVADGVITEVAVGVPPASSDVRLTGVLLPGLANGHSHAFHRGLRGRTHGDGGTFWTWRQQMYALAGRLDPDSYLHLATAVYAEMALAGYTAVGEFHYLHHDPNGQPYADPNAMGHALIEAADRAGIRLTLLDTCYLAGGLTAEGHQPLDRDQLRFGDGTVERWHDRWSQLRATPKARIGAAIHSVRAVPAA